MKKYKTLILAAFTSLSVSLVAPMGDQSVQAATWHKGTPVKVRGWWRTKMKKVKLGHGKYLWTYATMHITKNKIDGAFGTQSDHYEIKNIYSYTASKKTCLYALNGTLIPGKHEFFEAYQLTGKRKLETAELSTKGTVKKPIYKWYKFSGRSSNKTFYPYN
ncbi:hypothetical protein [Levilactobacillus brevis]|uniref:hypothetical protein n=1 Tax=Levilactobacillus brevis TaxID=1580 RepID=UPI001BDF531F|nr:hypothetical protein [Levilactobacillus brevis]